MTEPERREPTVQQGVAAGMYELEKLRMKLIVGRLLGIIAGVALWWVLLPVLSTPLPIIVGLLVALFGGLYIGQMVTLSMLRR